MMDDLENYIERRKKRSRDFADCFEIGYEQFKIGVMLRAAREQAGLTQEDVAERLRTRKSAGARMGKHAEDVRLSTLGKFARAVGKRLSLRIA
jgi:HTH-type transcriptional regulator / antitoxin HipB